MSRRFEGHQQRRQMHQNDNDDDDHYHDAMDRQQPLGRGITAMGYVNSAQSTSSSNADPFGFDHKKPPPPAMQQQRSQQGQQPPAPRTQRPPSRQLFQGKDTQSAISQQAQSIRTAKNASLSDYLTMAGFLSRKDVDKGFVVYDHRSRQASLGIHLHEDSDLNPSALPPHFVLGRRHRN